MSVLRRTFLCVLIVAAVCILGTDSSAQPRGRSQRSPQQGAAKNNATANDNADRQPTATADVGQPSTDQEGRQPGESSQSENEVWPNRLIALMTLVLAVVGALQWWTTAQLARLATSQNGIVARQSTIMEAQNSIMTAQNAIMTEQSSLMTSLNDAAAVQSNIATVQNDIAARQNDVAARQNKIIRRTTVIAQRQVAMTETLERAYVSASPVPPGFQVIDHPDGNRHELRLTIRLRNSGRTPAEVIWHEAAPVLGPLPRNPARPSLPSHDTSSSVIMPDDHIDVSVNYLISPEERAAIDNTELSVVGWLVYRDRFGKSHRHGYARRRVVPPAGMKFDTDLFFVHQTGYNYEEDLP